MKTPLSRRDFLKASALVTGAGLTAPLWHSRARAASATPTPTAAESDYPIAPGPFQPTR